MIYHLAPVLSAEYTVFLAGTDDVMRSAARSLFSVVVHGRAGVLSVLFT